jgi:2-succinyl-6-hydroxy-2,4-cyclohexadiene-1-carboxylate synthase
MMLAHAVTGDGPPLVMLHGFTGSRASWQPLLPVLAARFRTIVVDLPGHGTSPPWHGDAVALAEALVTLAARLGAQRAHWIGYSLGGRIALHVALHHPDAVERLVLEGASPGIEDAGERAARRAADDALAVELERDGLEAFVERWTAQPLFATQARLDPACLVRERAIRLASSAAGLAASLRTLGVGRQASLWAELPGVGAPATLVVGAEDAKFRAIAVGMAARMPVAHVAVVPSAGHAVHLERPAEFTAVVLDALAERAHDQHPPRRIA